MQTITKAKISRNNLMDYIHEDRDLLMGLQDDLSDMLYATGKFSITLDEVVNSFMPFFPLYLFENEEEIRQAFPDRIDKIVKTIVDASVEYQDSDMLNEWEDLLDVHTVLEEANND